MFSRSKEDYLKEIYRIQVCHNRAARTSELANNLKVAKPSVSGMVKTLSDKGLLKFEKYKGFTLTKEGVELARKVERKHQLTEVLLSKTLKVKKNYHEEAHKLEHEISDELSERISKYLKSPKVCPDGNPIPKKDAKVVNLDQLPVNKKAKVLFYKSGDSVTQERLNALGVVPGAEIKVMHEVSKGPVTISVKGSSIALSRSTCSNIFVEI